MRMARKGFQEPPRRFRRASPAQGNRRAPGRKKALNVSVDAALLALARDLGFNLSQVTEDALRKLTEPERIRRWRAANPGVIESYNKLVDVAGVFGEELLDLDDDPAV
jgi:antitoxin CcdA